MNPTTLLQHTAGAHAQWEPGPAKWIYAVDDWGPWVLAAIFIALLLRAVAHQRRYRAVAVFGTEAQSAVHDALLSAEAGTVGEIVPVVLERSDRHPEADWLSALVTLLIGTALLQGQLPWHAPHLLILCQLGLGAFGFLLARALPAWKRLFVSERRATEMALEQATQELFRLGLHQTTARTGVLMFVSLLERRVVVLGDIGIHQKVGDDHWQRTQTAVLDGVRRGRLETGLVEGIRATGSVLAEHFPWVHGDRNEIPDRVVVRHE
jgi:putative membrane protein